MKTIEKLIAFATKTTLKTVAAATLIVTLPPLFVVWLIAIFFKVIF